MYVYLTELKSTHKASKGLGLGQKLKTKLSLNFMVLFFCKLTELECNPTWIYFVMDSYLLAACLYHIKVSHALFLPPLVTAQDKIIISLQTDKYFSKGHHSLHGTSRFCSLTSPHHLLGRSSQGPLKFSNMSLPYKIHFSDCI